MLDTWRMKLNFQVESSLDSCMSAVWRHSSNSKIKDEEHSTMI
jgi:hypothetical protein